MHFNEVNILSPNDFRLHTLGRLTLLEAEGEPAADQLRRQRRKLAVLAMLAEAQCVNDIVLVGERGAGSVSVLDAPAEPRTRSRR